jgi:glycerophosphoryl diester phosphodiesterase
VRKVLLVMLTQILLVLSLPGSQVIGSTADQQGTPRDAVKKTIRVGHRGAAGLAPENTLAAFERAWEIGVDAVEMDAQLSADGKVVIHHDFSLNPSMTRAADGQWLNAAPARIIRDLSLAELKTYDIGRLRPQTAYARRYPEQQPVDGQRIPTLQEILELQGSKHQQRVQLWIEIKASPEQPAVNSPPEEIVDAVVSILRKENAAGRTRLLSFDWRALVHAQRVAPEIPTVYLTRLDNHLNNIQPGMPGPSPWTAGIDVDDFGGSIPRAIKAAGGRQWACHYPYLTAERVAEAHRLGVAVYAWTPDKPADMERLIRMQVDGIITNRPDLLQSVVKNP